MSAEPDDGTDLAALRGWLFAAVTGDAAVDSLIGDDRPLVLGGARDAAARGVAVYRAAYRHRLLAALRDDYPALAAACGDAAFTELARDYLARHPSRSPTLRDLGARLPEFLGACVGDGARAQEPPLAVSAELAALAALEWARVEVFDAADVPLACEDDARLVPAERWPGLTLTLAPCVRLLDLAWPIDEAWRRIDAGDAFDFAALPARATMLVVWRRDLLAVHRAIDARADEAVALRLVAAGAPFADLCDALAERMPPNDVAPRAFALLRQWLVDGLLARRPLIAG